MNKIKRTILQAPWRTRRQRVGTILLAIVGTSMVAALYLSVASQSTLIGREIQTLEREISLTKEENANLKTDLARTLSYYAIETRGDILGFRSATAEDIHYIIVPGYSGREPVALTNDTNLNTNHQTSPTEYSQSLFDWLELRLR